MKGKYVCLLGSDDELLPEALQTVVEKFGELASLEVKFLWFNCIDAEQGKLSGSGLKEESFVSYTDYLCEKIRGDYFFALDTGLLKGKRFDERLYTGGLELWLKILRATRAYYVPKVLYKAYREHGERICNPSMATLKKSIPKIAFAREVFLNEFGGEVKLLCPKNYAKRLAGLGFWQLISGKRYQGIKTLLNSLKYHFSLKVFVVFLLSPFLFHKKIAVLAARKYFQFYSLWK